MPTTWRDTGFCGIAGIDEPAEGTLTAPQREGEHFIDDGNIGCGHT